MGARDFNTDGANGGWESDGGAPGGTPDPPTMTDPGPAQPSATGTATAAQTQSAQDYANSLGGGAEYAAPGSQGPVGMRTISDTGSGLSLNDTGSKPLPKFFYNPGGVGAQNTGGFNFRVMFEDGGEVTPGMAGKGVGDKINSALMMVDHAMDYGRQKAGLSQGGQQGGQQAASGLLTPGGNVDADDGRGVGPGFQGDKKFSQFARPDNVDDRRVADNSPREGPETWLDHFRVLPDVAKADIQDMGRDLKNLYAPSQMSKDAGINDLGSTLDRGPLSDPDAVNEQYDNTQSQPPQQQYGVPTDDTEGRY